MPHESHEWLRVGGPVYVDGRRDVSRGVIEKLTKTQVVLESGQRFNRVTRRQVGGTSWDTDRLLAPDDPWAREKERQQRQANAAWRVELTAEKFRQDPSEKKAQAVEDALATWRRLASLVQVGE